MIVLLSNSSSTHVCYSTAQSSNRMSFGTPPMQSNQASHPWPLRAYVEDRLKVGRTIGIQSMRAKDSETRIREQLLKPKLSLSSYDTAWVAMVPLQGSLQTPRFRQCFEWILQNQYDNGAWGLDPLDSSLNKDALSSTLACILALKRWNVGEEHIRRGLHFIEKTFSCIMDEKLVAPIGFNIIFPGMLKFAIEMGLDLPLDQSNVDRILRLRDMELKREAGNESPGRKAYMAYVAEGLENLQDWNEVMRFQRKNGSLFNSPSTTAAALTYNYDAKALEYLNSLTKNYGSAVPTAYPLEIYSQLCTVDALEKLGISWHFAGEIKSILDMTYSCWLQGDEEIMLDVATYAMAFRLLRMNGYDISSDELSRVAEEANFFDSVQGHVNDTQSLLELYKASKIAILENESILDKIGSWSERLLKEQLCSNEVQRWIGSGEVDHALKVPFYATMERLDHKRNIEHFDTGCFQMLKAAYRCCLANGDLLALAIEDFNVSQSIYQEEFQHLERWVKENRLDQLQFARQKQAYCYLSAAATMFYPELSDARISWAKNSVLATVIDDFFDVGGSREELQNLITLVEKWDRHHENEFYSEQVKILFSALYATVNHLGAKASVLQNRCVTEHMIEIWLDALRSMMKESEWRRNQFVPTMEEYMINATISYISGPVVLPASYFVGPKVSEDIVKDPEYNELFTLMSVCGRILNDLQSYEREGTQGKLNSVSLLVLHGGSSTSIELAKEEMKRSLFTSSRALLRLVLREGSKVPRPCKELFWKYTKVNHLFYFHTDGYNSPREMMSMVDAVIHEPLQVSHQSLAEKD